MTAVPDVVRPAGQSDRWRVLAEKLAPNASRLDLDYFAEAAHHLGLTPFSSPPEIVLIDRYDSRVGRTVYRPQVTIEGRLALARRTGRVVGIEGPHYTGPRPDWTDQNGDRIWIDAWDVEDEGGYPRAARYLIHIAGDVVPTNGTAPWSEFAQHDKNGKLLKTWEQMPTTMLSKCALSLGLRRSGIEKLPADIPVDYEGDSTIEPTETDTPPVVPAPAGDRAVTSAVCSACGHLTAAHSLWPIPQGITHASDVRPVCHACRDEHRECPAVESPGPASEQLPVPDAPLPPAQASAGPGSTYKSRKPARRPVETGPPVDYYDSLPEAQGRA
jgi:hypothetical protein